MLLFAGFTIDMFGANPVVIVEFAVPLSAIGLPLCYLATLLVARDRAYMGQFTNGKHRCASSLTRSSSIGPKDDLVQAADTEAPPMALSRLIGVTVLAAYGRRLGGVRGVVAVRPQRG